MHWRVGIWKCAEESLQFERHVVKFSAGVSLSLKVSVPQREPKVKLTVNLKVRSRVEIEVLLNKEEPISQLLRF